MVVQKYGGSSVGSPDKIKRVAARVARAKASEGQVVVVVSAMGDTTDELIELARQVTHQPQEREMDMLLSVGERISMALLSMALRDLGHEAISFTGSQAGIITDESHTRARILELRPTRVREELDRGKIVIVAGFQGVSRGKEITTLGRGGSDTTAVALASALCARRCEIYTDVPGIFSADPRVVSGARRYDRLPLDLVFEMAVKGAQIMHARSIEIAREKGLSLYVGLAHPLDGKEMGTMLVPEQGIELPKIVAITAKRGLSELRFGASNASAVLEELARETVLTHNLCASDGQLTVLVDPNESRAFLARHADKIKGQGLTAVSVIGYQLQQSATTVAQVSELAAKLGAQPAGLTCHPQSITVWFPDAPNGELSNNVVRTLHEALVK